MVSLLGPRETDIVVVQAQERAVPWSPQPRDLICGRYKREECANYVEIGGKFIVARARVLLAFKSVRTSFSAGATRGQCFQEYANKEQRPQEIWTQM